MRMITRDIFVYPAIVEKTYPKMTKRKSMCVIQTMKCVAQFAVVTALINAGIPMKQESIIMLTEFVAHPVAKNVP